MQNRRLHHVQLVEQYEKTLVSYQRVKALNLLPLCESE